MNSKEEKRQAAHDAQVKARKAIAVQLTGAANGILSGELIVLSAIFQNGYVMKETPLDLKEPQKCVPGPDTLVVVHLRDRQWFNAAEPVIVGPEGN